MFKASSMLHRTQCYWVRRLDVKMSKTFQLTSPQYSDLVFLVCLFSVVFLFSPTGRQLPPVGTFPPSSSSVTSSGKKALSGAFSTGPVQPVPDKDPEEKMAELMELKQMKYDPHIF